MRKIIVLCMLLMIVPPVAAKMYKCEDPEGNTVYTDEPCADGKQLKLPPILTYTPSKLPPASATTGKNSKDDKNHKGYTSLVITKPEDDSVIRDNEGKVTINYTLTPPLKTALGHKFVISVNGKKLKTKGTTSQIQLTDLVRGTHTILIHVVDDEDKTIISSKPSSFHMKQFSILHPKPASALPPPPPPPPPTPTPTPPPRVQ